MKSAASFHFSLRVLLLSVLLHLLYNVSFGGCDCKESLLPVPLKGSQVLALVSSRLLRTLGADVTYVWSFPSVASFRKLPRPIQKGHFITLKASVLELIF